MNLELSVQRAVSAPAPDDAVFEAAARAALAGRREAAEVCVRLVDEPESAELNNRYRDQNAATNVLSFPCDAALPEADVPLGDLVICAAVVMKEAAAQGKCLNDHWQHLVVHGVLHLLGYDHIREDDAGIMENEERAILAGLGCPDPYAPPDQHAADTAGT